MHMYYGIRRLFLSIHEPEMFLIGVGPWLQSIFPEARVSVVTGTLPRKQDFYGFGMLPSYVTARTPMDPNIYRIIADPSYVDGIIETTLLARVPLIARALARRYVNQNKYQHHRTLTQGAIR